VSKAKLVNWRMASPTPLMLISGQEEYLASRVIRSIREQLRLSDANLEIHELDASDYAAGQLLNLSSPSLFAEPRLIIARGFERCTDDFIIDGLDYLNRPTEDTTVIFRHNSSSVRGKKLLDALRNSSEVSEIACLAITKDADRNEFVQSEFRQANRKITVGAQRAILEAFTDDLGELAAACSQLLTDSAETIDEQTVERYYGGRVETNAFKVIDAALAGKSGESLALMRHALATGADPVPMLIAFAMKIRQLAKLSSNRSATAVQLGMAPWLLDKVRRDLQSWTEPGLANIIVQLASTDAAIKGAERDPVYALERLILSIANKGITK